MCNACDGLVVLFLQVGGRQTDQFGGSVGYLGESIAIFDSEHIEKTGGTVQKNRLNNAGVQ